MSLPWNFGHRRSRRMSAEAVVPRGRLHGSGSNVEPRSEVPDTSGPRPAAETPVIGGSYIPATARRLALFDTEHCKHANIYKSCMRAYKVVQGSKISYDYTNVACSRNGYDMCLCIIIQWVIRLIVRSELY